TVAEERKVYRSPERAAKTMPGPNEPAPPPKSQRPQRGRKPRRKRSRRQRSRLVLALCLLCLLVVVGVCLVLTRCSSGPTGPEQANFGTTAA
ncbi:hypothetical protein H6B10_16290, partial [Gemmiger formicilis]|uniref:hypothetical protein n=1 Tax=Gemmiger formicilis TaxID=745368 RepID=UPI001DE21DFF|nr:hypothetical protein [Gemmiger formicilis]